MLHHLSFSDMKCWIWCCILHSSTRGKIKNALYKYQGSEFANCCIVFNGWNTRYNIWYNGPVLECNMRDYTQARKIQENKQKTRGTMISRGTSAQLLLRQHTSVLPFWSVSRVCVQSIHNWWHENLRNYSTGWSAQSLVGRRYHNVIVPYILQHI